ncbi:hypothetical protein ACFU44_13795 [Nocardia rhizosphaerihabitans]|uniref:hypothetical protein n=1 Tax=Nocardia rhizosphaerihabitans TaxID=1691570 RepID=UPI0036715CF4
MAPDDTYSPMDITNDAADFAKTRFGQHYLDRLRDDRQRNIDTATRRDLTDSYRAHAMTAVNQIDRELDYFSTAEKISNDPTLMQKLRDGFLKRIGRKEKQNQV